MRCHDTGRSLQKARLHSTTTLQSLRSLGIAGLIASGLFGAPQVFAQSSDIKAISNAAAAGDAQASYTLGEAFLYGINGVDAAPERAFQYLKAASDAGNAKAQRLLGEALLWGSHLPQDLTAARSWLQVASNAGDAEARRVLGQQLIGGWILDRDIAAGRALLDDAIQDGDAKAHVILAQFYLYGPLRKSFSRAEELVEIAAKAGEPAGLHDYGGALMWSWSDWQKAESYLTRAAEADVPEAWATLAEGAMFGYLGPQSRRKFDGYAQKAREAGVEKVAVLEAQRRIWGISQRASGPRTIAGLEEAAAEGNRTALRYLISLTRDGNQYNIRKEPERARQYLTDYAVYLSPTEREQFALTIDAVRERSLPGFKRIVAQIKGRPDLMTPWFLNEMYKANANVVFYLLQEQEKARGLYKGAMDGLAGPKTVKATFEACVDLPYRGGACGQSIFKSDMVGQLLLKR